MDNKEATRSMLLMCSSSNFAVDISYIGGVETVKVHGLDDGEATLVFQGQSQQDISNTGSFSQTEGAESRETESHGWSFVTMRRLHLRGLNNFSMKGLALPGKEGRHLEELECDDTVFRGRMQDFAAFANALEEASKIGKGFLSILSNPFFYSS